MKKHTAKWEKDGWMIRSFQKGEEEKYYNECFEIPDEEVNRLTGSYSVYDHERVVRYYQRVVDDPDRYDFIMIDPSGRFIGESVINEIDWEARSANFRIVIFHSEDCSKGIGSWAVRETRDFAFGVLGLHRLELDVFSFNERAIRAYKKAGFQIEGIRRDAVWDGKSYGDDILMAILEKEWQDLREKEKGEMKNG
ncbi:MAG: GNAT family N-acetyltransferase [Fusicatenibacter sp.]|nr:GNAT family N-acetyltransferase [Fusicatenibacter sp.]